MTAKASLNTYLMHPKWRDHMFRLLRKRFRRFHRLFMMVLLLPFIVLLIRLMTLQVFQQGYYQHQALKTRTQSLTVFRRGRIVDRNGVILAQDITLYDLFAHPRYYYDSKPLDVAQKLSPILEKPVDELKDKLSQDLDTIRLGRDVPKSKIQAIRALQMPMIDAPAKMVRRYPQGHLASHVVGYVNDEAQIAAGVEKSAESILKKAPDLPNIQRTRDGNLINVENISTDFVTNVPHADDVQLTIDSRIQFIAESALNRGLKRTRAERGAVIVMDPKTGELLAFAVQPDFDPEKFRKAKPEFLKNWAISDVYPPGSTFKILTVACGLESGVINKHSKIFDNGRITTKDFTIANYDYFKRGAPGTIDLVYLFQHSSNIGSFKISQLMPPRIHRNLLVKFGIGQHSGIDLPGESKGLILPLDQWDDLTHGTIGYGYGLASTPLQMAAAISAIANRGMWVTPHVLMQTPVKKRRAISEQTAKDLTELLAISIEAQKKSSVMIPGLNVAGKTGTSLKPREKGKGYSSNLFTSFVGFYPASDPKALVMVVIDSPKIGNAWGATVAGPIFREVALKTAGYLGIKPATITTNKVSEAT